MRRSQFQRIAVPILGLLLVAVLWSQVSHLFVSSRHGSRCEREARIERHRGPHHGRHADRDRSQPRESRIHPTAFSAASRDVLFDETFRVGSGDDLVVDLGAEAVVIETTNRRDARVTVDGRGRDARREFERRRFSARTSGDRLTVRTSPPRGWRSGRTDASFTVTVQIPETFDVSVDVGSGSVRVGPRLRGDLSVDTGSGSVTVGDVTGRRIVLDTGSGSVQAGRLVGSVRVDTGSGSVRLDAVDGPLSVDTGSGSVAVDRQSGAATVSTGSGGIRLALATVAPLTLDAGSGSVEVRLPRNASADVDLDGSSVRIDDAFDFSGSRDRDEARGRIGRGGPRIAASTSSGSVSLRAD